MKKGQKGAATVLERKSKFGTFEQVVCEDDEFSHEGGESEFFSFAPSEETEVGRSEDRVMAGGDKCGHVKDGADLRAAAEDVALPAELATVVVKANGRMGVSLRISANLLDLRAEAGAESMDASQRASGVPGRSGRGRV
jgi:hypothetical protein